jgi:hypothetical protein
MSALTVTAAYGRSYTSIAAARKDWYSDKDFIMQPGGRYINRQQADEFTVFIRYCYSRKIAPAEYPHE